jgi:hypothetical protein
MRLFPEDNVEDPCDCVVLDHCDGVESSLFPYDIIAGSVHGKFIHRSLLVTVLFEEEYVFVLLFELLGVID